MNKNNGMMADLPIGNCQVQKNRKTFESNGRQVCLETKTEKRSYGSMEILEKESTRVFKSKNCVSMLQVIVVVENGQKRKIVEYLNRKFDGEITHIHRHKRITDHLKVMEDYVFNTTLEQETVAPLMENQNRLHRVYK